VPPAGRPAQGEGEQRQGLAAVGIGDQRSGQPCLEAQSGHLGGPFDDVAQHLPVQRGQYVSLDRHAGQRGERTEVIKELRPHRRNHTHRASDRVPQQLDESRHDGRGRPSEQLLGLVDHHQQSPLLSARTGRQQVIGHAPQAIRVGFEPAADVVGRPAQLQTGGGGR
jgi:hypothetical protein